MTAFHLGFQMGKQAQVLTAPLEQIMSSPEEAYSKIPDEQLAHRFALEAIQPVKSRWHPVALSRQRRRAELARDQILELRAQKLKKQQAVEKMREILGTLHQETPQDWKRTLKAHDR